MTIRTRLNPSAAGYLVPLTVNSPASYTLTAANSSGSATSTINVTWTAALALALPSPFGMVSTADNRTLYITTNQTSGTSQICGVVAVDAGKMTQIGAPCTATGFATLADPTVMPNGDLVVLAIEVSASGNPYNYVALLTPTGNSDAPLSMVGSVGPIGIIPTAVAVTATQVLVTEAEWPNNPGQYLELLVPNGQSSQPFTRTQAIQISATSESDDSAIAISPDGSRAFVAYPSAVVAFDLTQSPIIQIGSPLSLAGPATAAAISQDGKTLYLAIPSTGSVELIDVTASTSAPLTASGTSISITSATKLAISPDSSAMMVLSMAANNPTSIYLVDLLATPPQVAAGPLDVQGEVGTILVPPGPLSALLTVFYGSTPGLYTFSRSATGGTLAANANAAWG